MRLADSAITVMRGDSEYPLECTQLRFGDRKVCFVRTSRISKKRIATFSWKEPTTLLWLEELTPQDVLVDVGANVGSYSIYGAVMSGCRVVAIEPESQNFAELCKNIVANGLNGKVVPYCLAASDRSTLGLLRVSRFVAGWSHHDAGDRFEGKATKMVEKEEDRFRQGVALVALDDFFEGHAPDVVLQPMPTALKIDVDGLENLVLGGALNLLRSQGLWTVLLEVDHKISASKAWVERLVKEFGFSWTIDQRRTDRYGVHSAGECARRVEAGLGGNNVIFYRGDRGAALERKLEAFAGTWKGEEAMKAEAKRRGLPL